MSGVVLGHGLFQRPILEEPAPPSPQEDLLTQVLDAMTALRAAVATLPTPTVHVEPQDLSDVVNAVQALNGPAGPSAGEIALAIKDVLAPHLPGPQQLPVTELVEALKLLDFRMKGMTSGGRAASGASALTNEQLRATPVVVDAGDGISRDLSVQTATVTPGGPFTVTPTSGKKLRVWWVSVIGDPDNSSTGTVTVALTGKGTLYKLPAMSHRQRFDGATDGTLTFTADDGTFGVTVHYEEIT